MPGDKGDTGLIGRTGKPVSVSAYSAHVLLCMVMNRLLISRAPLEYLGTTDQMGSQE